MPLTLRERIDDAGGFTRRLLGSWRYWSVVAATIALFTLAGPFGTFEQAGLAGRLVYWAATMVATSVVAILVLAGTHGLAPPTRRLTLPVLLGGSVLACVPNTFVVAALIPPLLGTPGPPLAALVLHVLPVGIAIGAVTWLVFDRTATRDDAVEAASENPLLLRLPVEKRGEVVRMSMQDHYVEVVTVRGERARADAHGGRGCRDGRGGAAHSPLALDRAGARGGFAP